MDDRRWRFVVAGVASVVMSLPLILYGTPEVEQYYRSIFSTIKFARNLAAGVDPWFVPDYGFGISLPSSTWLVKYPVAIPAALIGIDALYGAIWVSGTFVFSWYFLRLAGLLIRGTLIPCVLLATGLLSFSQLGPTYVDDWPTHFLGWSLLPACLWFTMRTLAQESGPAIARSALACALAFQIFATSAHLNQIVTVFAGFAVFLVSFVRKRTLAVFAVGAAMAIALLAAIDVLAPTVQGMRQTGVDPTSGPIAFYTWSEDTWVRAEPPVTSYSAFLEPFWSGFRNLAASESGAWVRMPFFGLGALCLAIVGAARAIRGHLAVGSLPTDMVRGLAIGFVANSVATLLPSAVLLNVPRMYLFRDGQTLFGLLCAAIAIEWIRTQFPQWLRVGLLLHLAQITVVGVPIMWFVVTSGDRSVLFAYARREHVLIDQLKGAGVNEHSRVLLAGEIEHEIYDEDLSESGLTALTDFSLAGIPLANATYRGALTPTLGTPPRPGRYGTYETVIAWDLDLRQMNGDALDVLGISHVVAYEDEPDVRAWAGQVALTEADLLPGARPVRVFRNQNAWSRAVLLAPGGIIEPAFRPGCLTITIYCRDYGNLVKGLSVHLRSAWEGSTLRIELPSTHTGGTILVSQVLGSNRTALVDGQPRAVRLFLDTFGMLEVLPGERAIALSMRPTNRTLLSLVGFFVIAVTGLLVLVLRRSAPALRLQ